VNPPYGFAKAFDFVEYMPANRRNLLLDNFPTFPEKVVIHQFGTLGVDTLTSTINTFQSPYLDRVASAHFVVSGKRIIQMVGLKDRAYHAGPIGNDYIGIETDPAQDADTIESTKKLLKALREKYGYELVKVLHKDVPENNTNCGASITLSNYDLPDFREAIIREFAQFVTENLIQGYLNRNNRD
jgi:N-acetylmuramoyl-L-alanine amidase CwlA